MEKQMEKWVDVPCYGGAYKVSNMGRVFSVGYGLMRGFDNGFGYKVVSFSKNNKRKNYYVHRLVADAFCVHEHGKDFVNHINHNKCDNRAENLEWVTQQENVIHSVERMRKPRKTYRNSNTGYKYITKTTQHGKIVYRVCVYQKCVDRCFKNLEDAVAFRNEVIPVDWCL